MKKHCVSYPTKSLIFGKSLLFFQNKQELLVVLVISLFVSILFHSTYANFTKI